MEMIAAMMVAMIAVMMKTRYLCGEMQLQASLKANAPQLTVPNAAKAGTTAILMPPQNTVARMTPSSCTQISAAKAS